MLVDVRKRVIPFTAIFLAAVCAAQTPTSAATFVIKDDLIPAPLSFIVYGDQRFTDPANTAATSPKMRQLLVKQIAKEHPAAVILNGDVPLAGNVKNDYAVFQTETQPWRNAGLRDAGLNVVPALGNHEMHGNEHECIQNWWDAFPSLRNRRWYSTQLGSHVYVIALDSNSSLLPDSDQQKWLAQQIDSLSSTVDFVVITMHHP